MTAVQMAMTDADLWANLQTLKAEARRRGMDVDPAPPTPTLEVVRASLVERIADGGSPGWARALVALDHAADLISDMQKDQQ